MSDETTESADGRDLAREITVHGHRFIWERHASDAYLIDLMLLKGESETLAMTGALVLAYPRMARTARFRRNLGDAAERLYNALVEQGWSVAEIMQAGMHAFVWLAGHLPPSPKDPEVEEAVGFSGAQPASTPAG